MMMMQILITPLVQVYSGLTRFKGLNMTFLSFSHAAKHAVYLSRKNSEDYYVIFEDGEYHAASDYDLETYFCGSSPIGYAGYGLNFEPL
jgi:hypothetical protein